MRVFNENEINIEIITEIFAVFSIKIQTNLTRIKFIYISKTAGIKFLIRSLDENKKRYKPFVFVFRRRRITFFFTPL